MVQILHSWVAGLVEELIAMHASNGPVSLLESQRPQLVHALMRATVGPVGRDEYLALLTSGFATGSRPVAYAPAEDRMTEMLEGGLAALPDEELIALALSAEAIRALTDRVTVALAGGVLGDVWMEAIDDIASVPEDYLGPAAVERNRAKLRELIADPTDESPPTGGDQ